MARRLLSPFLDVIGVVEPYRHHLTRSLNRCENMHIFQIHIRHALGNDSLRVSLKLGPSADKLDRVAVEERKVAGALDKVLGFYASQHCAAFFLFPPKLYS